MTPTCGPCTLCCKVMGIKEGHVTTDTETGEETHVLTFVKEKDQWCQHASSRQGCRIYETRPQACRDFECLWLQGRFGGGDPAFRPDKIHAVLIPTTDRKNLVIHEDPGYRGHARTALRDIIKDIISDPDRYVIVVSGTERKFYGTPEKMARLKADSRQASVEFEV